MRCRHCGTEIADKAIVCYRCGTGTAEPVRKPAEIRRRRSPLVLVILLALLAVLAWYLGHATHVFGLELIVQGGSAAPDSAAVLIDLPPIDA